MPARLNRPIELLPGGSGRERREPRPDCANRLPVPGDAVLRGPADDLAPAGRRASGERPAGAPADAADGSDADLPGAANQHPCQGAQDLSLPAAGAGDRTAQPGLTFADVTIGCRASGAQTSPTSPWQRSSCTWWRSWTG